MKFDELAQRWNTIRFDRKTQRHNLRFFLLSSYSEDDFDYGNDAVDNDIHSDENSSRNNDNDGNHNIITISVMLIPHFLHLRSNTVYNHVIILTKIFEETKTWK